MTREDKATIIEQLKDKFSQTSNFYITDYSTLTVAQINKLRRTCFEQGVEIKVLKNTLIRKALEQVDENAYVGIFDSLKGPTAIMFSNAANLPARILKDFREDHEKPTLRAAYIDSSIFEGDDRIEALSKLKSKEELIGEVIGLLQSPMSNLLGSLQSGKHTLAGLIKTLSEREEE